MRPRFLLPALAFLVACGVADQPRFLRPPSKRSEELVIVALGDSLTAGVGVDAGLNYPSLLQAKLDAAGVRARVVNAGVSGDTSAEGLARVPAVLEESPDIVIVALGANDYLRGLGTEQAETNLRATVTQLRAGGAYVVLAGFRFPSNLFAGGRINAAVEDIYPALAEELRTATIEDFLDGVSGKAALNQNDKIHPTAAGYRAIVDENVWPVMEEILARELRAD